MSLVGNVSIITVTGRFVDVLDQPMTGQVKFTPSTSSAIVSAAGDVVVSNQPISVALDSTGTFVVGLPATDDPNLNPSFFTYEVEEPTKRRYNITASVNTAGGILDLVTVAPASSANAGVVQAVSGRGITQGIVNPQGHLILTFTDGETADAGSVVTGGIDLTNYYTKAQADQAISAATSGFVATSDTRLTNARTPTVHASTHSAGGADPLSLSGIGAVSTSAVGASSGVASLDGGAKVPITQVPTVTSGTTSSTGVPLANDARLSNARTPTSHASTHVSGGSDSLRLDQLANPTSTVNAGGQRIGNGADPVGNTDFATRGWVLANTGSGGGGETGTGSILGATDYDNTTAPTDGQAILWANSESEWHPGTVVLPSDARLSDPRTPIGHASSHASGGSDAVSPTSIGAAPTSHQHSGGDVTSGTVGYARLPVGTSTNTVAAGDDSRITGAQQSSGKDTANGYPGLDGSSKLAIGRLPTATSGASSASLVPLANDARLSDARTPTSHTHAAGDVTSGTVAYGRLPVGTTSGSTVCDGGDSRLSNSRNPLAHVHSGADVTSGTVAYPRLPVGTGSSTVAAGNDSRLSDARTPTSHANSHRSSGSDPVPAAIVYPLTMPTAYTNITAAYNSPTQVGSTLTIPDPGFPYIMQIAGMIVTRSGAAGNQRTDLSVRLSSITGTEILHATGNPTLPANTFIQVTLSGGWPQSGKLTGATSLVLGAGTFGGTGVTVTGQVGGQSGFDPGNFLNITLIPA